MRAWLPIAALQRGCIVVVFAVNHLSILCAPILYAPFNLLHGLHGLHAVVKAARAAKRLQTESYKSGTVLICMPTCLLSHSQNTMSS